MVSAVTSQPEDVLLDQVTDLSRLSDRQLIERLARGQQRLERALSSATDYMTAALDSLDVQMKDLQTRLQGDAAALAAAVEGLKQGQLDEAALSAAADRVQATAVVVAGLAQPTVVADPNTPNTAGPLPAA